MNKVLQIIAMNVFIAICGEPTQKTIENIDFQEPLQEGLIIILDRSNTEFLELSPPASTKTCAFALQAQSSILVSRSILAHVLLSESEYIIPLRNQLIEQNIFNNWTIKELDSYYILIPKDKFNNLSNYLAIKNLKEISFDDIKKEYDSFIKYAALGSYALVSLGSTFSHLFPKTPPIQALKKLFLPQLPQTAPMLWSIFLLGHGMYEGYLVKGSIADLSIKEFQDFLNFLQSRIKTKILIYASCYAGGSNKIKAFNDSIKKDISKTYSFPIIITSVTEAVSFAADINFKILFDSLFKENYTLPNYYQIFENAGFLSELLNFPQIRLPGSSWFSVESLNTLPQNKDYAIISRVKGSTRKKEMSIPASKRIIFVYSPLIPFLIKIEEPILPMPSFSFMAPSVSHYHFKEIETSKNLYRIINCLASIASRTPLSYLIYIDRLTCSYQDKMTIFNNCILELKPYILSQGYSAKLYARITQTDGSQATGEYNLDYQENTFATYDVFTITNKDYTKQFLPAPPFEQFNELEKMVEKKAALGYLQKEIPEDQNSRLNNLFAEFNKKMQVLYMQTKIYKK